jgi:hypothetical protein
MSKMDIETCFYCSQGGHSGTTCPELRTPLNEGFTGEGGGGGHLDDDDE